MAANDRLRAIFGELHGGGVIAARRLGEVLGADAGDRRGFARRYRPQAGWLPFLWRALWA